MRFGLTASMVEQNSDDVTAETIFMTTIIIIVTFIFIFIFVFVAWIFRAREKRGNRRSGKPWSESENTLNYDQRTNKELG